MIAWILLLATIVFFMALLLTPLRLEVDSRQGIYQLCWYGLATLRWLPDEGADILEIRTFFFSKKISLSAQVSPEQKDALKPVRKNRSVHAVSSGRTLKLILDILKSFRVLHCRIDWDTDDFVLNAWLFPVFMFLGKRFSPVSINFMGQRNVEVVVENNAGRLLWAFSKSIMFT